MLPCMNSLFSSQLHLNLFLLDMLHSLDIILLLHLSLPPLKLSRVPQIHLKIFGLLLILLFLLLKQVTLSHYSSRVYFNKSRFLIKIRHWLAMLFIKLYLFTSLLFDLLLCFLQLHRTVVSCEGEGFFC